MVSRIAVRGKIASVKVAGNKWQNKPADTKLKLDAPAPLPVIPEEDATTPGCRRATLTATNLLDNAVMRDGLADQMWDPLRAAMLGTLWREVNARPG